MCEFCHTHGEGKKWYLQARNYSDDLLADLRRRRFIEDFFRHPESTKDDMERLDRLHQAPRWLQSLIRRRVTGRMKRVHYGQVVPLEDVERIFGMVNSIVRLACYCRHLELGSEKRYCYGFSMTPGGGLPEILRRLDDSFVNGPHTAGLETLSREEALAAFREHEKEGLCHSVWTFHAPFIGGLCNCDRSDCLALKTTVTHGVPILFRAEYVAVLDAAACDGCRLCLQTCQFGGLTYRPSLKQVFIDPRWCYGCGVCRARCKRDAIRLVDRREVPAAARLW
ncbi:MAG: 4Fe-4S ferredoxin [Candidatus Zixiibacteriota bacterium]|nr:MAG: 4Fe-4S ferredoxin [candidate division Zixibacteria bacterium]